MSDGDWPFPAQDMFAFVPASIIEQLGYSETTVLNGEQVAIDGDRIAAFIAAMEEAGFRCTRDDDAIQAAWG